MQSEALARQHALQETEGNVVYDLLIGGVEPSQFARSEKALSHPYCRTQTGKGLAIRTVGHTAIDLWLVLECAPDFVTLTTKRVSHSLCSSSGRTRDRVPP
jgi:hypothetical protein